MKTLLPICIVLFFALDAIGQPLVPVFKQTSTVIPFALSDVRLKESPFLEAQRTDAKYILALDEDRLLAPFLKDAGLSPLKPNYGNWESQGLDGHIAGHYLSAVAQMYAATGDTVFLNRLNYMLGWLGKCQERNGNGYVGGIPGGRQLWKEIAAGRVNAIRSRWAPWYNLHKLYSGLIDSYFLTGSNQAKRILVRLADWCLNLTSGLSDDQMEQMLGEEQGGMNEALANAAYITRDPKYLELARRFSHRAILRPLLHQEDSLTGLHANTQIPKVVGFMRIAQLTGDSSWAHAAEFFWNTVTRRRTVVFGGNSVREHFNPTDDFSSMLESREGPESCNSYNMLKLTKELFLSDPAGRYMDYYERTLYNHILSSQDPKGGFVYFTPIRPGHYRVYSSPQQSFWCCVGTGMENHGKYGELIYAHKDDQLYVNLFIPSTLNWKEKGVQLNQMTSFPFSDTTTLTLSLTQSQKFVLKLRCPSWIDGEASVWVNGQRVAVRPWEDGYLSLDRTWKNKDRIVLRLPMRTTAEPLPDGSRWVAFLHGPIVLAAPTGTEDLEGLWADSSRWGHIARGKMLPLD
ncbi:MAG TPA: beta-L-arabinofuranosidase domain-containing protein, partial [Puia sp.]|nr:beta-L-arabinofuranosidase domain-containing protein [Puia sp.]